MAKLKKTSKETTRFNWLIYVVVFLMAIAVGKAFYVMTVKRTYWESMGQLLVREGRELAPKRGNILSADGQVLASSLPEYRVFIDFMTYETDTARRRKDQLRRDTLLDVKMDSIVNGVHDIFPDVIPERLREHLLEGRKNKSHYWPLFVPSVTTDPRKRRNNHQISYVEYSLLKKLPLFRVKSSVNYEKIEMRRRPFGALARTTVGEFRDSARFGLERTFDAELSGRPGRFHYKKVMSEKVPVVDVPAEDGYDVQTTIDVNMQEICEKALGDKLRELEDLYGNVHYGICILMEVATGDVKAITSLARQEDGTFREDFDRAVRDIHEPGSVFKPQSFLVAFDDGKISMNDQVDTGHGIYDFGAAKMKDHNYRNGGYGLMTVPEIIGKSSNIGVSVLINRAYHDDPDKFIDGLQRVGSLEDHHFPLDGYQAPRVIRPASKMWSKISLPWLSIGYVVQTTPINTIAFYNGIANNGRMMRPRLVKALRRDGEVVKEYPPVVVREHMASEKAVRQVQECLEFVTTKGVGRAANSHMFATAGKTGTAQVWSAAGRSSSYFVTFAGYFPVDQPQYSCIVCIERPAPASGGSQCGPVFRRVAENVMASTRSADYSSAANALYVSRNTEHRGNMAMLTRLLSQLRLPRDGAPANTTTPVWGKATGTNAFEITESAAADETRVPDVVGYGLRDAICRLEGLGLKVKTHGVGHVVKQSLSTDHVIKRGEVITLTLDYDHGDKPHARAVAPPAPADSVPAATPAAAAAPDSRTASADSRPATGDSRTAAPASSAAASSKPKEPTSKPKEPASKPKEPTSPKPQKQPATPARSSDASKRRGA